MRNISDALRNAGEAIAERIRHESQGSPMQPFNELIRNEVMRLRGEGQVDLADALAQLCDL